MRQSLTCNHEKGETMKRTFAFVACTVAVLGAAAFAQAPAAAPPASVKVLAIGTISAAAGQETPALLQQQVRDTVNLYLDGRIEHWFARQDRAGVVLLLNIRTADEARAALADLPLVKANILTFELIPVGPLMPLRVLLKPQP